MSKVYKKKGSITVEMTLLMPFVLALFIFIVFSSFFLHDRCLIDKACLSAALRGSETKNEEHVNEEIKKALYEVLSDKMLGKWEYTTEIVKKADKIEVCFNGEMNMTRGLLTKILKGGRTNYSYKAGAYVIYANKYIRTKKKSGVGYCL